MLSLQFQQSIIRLVVLSYTPIPFIYWFVKYSYCNIYCHFLEIATSVHQQVNITGPIMVIAFGSRKAASSNSLNLSCLLLLYCIIQSWYVNVLPSDREKWPCMQSVVAKRVCVTGAAGQIAYSLIFAVARGDLLGPNQPVIIHLLDIPPMMGVLEGTVMELYDCAFPLLQGYIYLWARVYVA